jgi:hypothetical protein
MTTLDLLFLDGLFITINEHAAGCDLAEDLLASGALPPEQQLEPGMKASISHILERGENIPCDGMRSLYMNAGPELTPERLHLLLASIFVDQPSERGLPLRDISDSISQLLAILVCHYKLEALRDPRDLLGKALFSEGPMRLGQSA